MLMSELLQRGMLHHFRAFTNRVGRDRIDMARRNLFIIAVPDRQQIEATILAESAFTQL